jgi:hypothetical protein
VISRSTLSEITDQLWEDYEAFRSPDLAGIELVTYAGRVGQRAERPVE